MRMKGGKISQIRTKNKTKGKNGKSVEGICEFVAIADEIDGNGLKKELEKQGFAEF